MQNAATLWWTPAQLMLADPLTKRGPHDILLAATSSVVFKPEGILRTGNYWLTTQAAAGAALGVVSSALLATRGKHHFSALLAGLCLAKLPMAEAKSIFTTSDDETWHFVIFLAGYVLGFLTAIIFFAGCVVAYFNRLYMIPVRTMNSRDAIPAPAPVTAPTSPATLVGEPAVLAMTEKPEPAELHIELEMCTRGALRDQCRRRGLSTQGLKAELLSRLRRRVG